MAHYINKDTVVAEIESLKRTTFTNFDEGVNCAAQTLLETIDALEVKDVDIGSEVSNWWNSHYTGVKQGYTFEGYSGHYMENSTIVNLAQYFYGLGLKSQQS